MVKNELPHTALLAGLVLAALLLMHFLPRLEVGGRLLRRVDLLADVRPLPPVQADTLPAVLSPPKPIFVDTCPPGMTCIEDYGDSTGRGMENFYQRYGGCGVGYVDITSPITYFRRTVYHAFGGWESHAWTDSIGFDRSRQGLSGRYFEPLPGAYVELRGRSDYAPRLDTCRRAGILFANGSPLHLAVRLNGEKTLKRAFAPSDRLQMAMVEGRLGRVRWMVERADKATVFYGLFMDDVRGIALDNLSLRGSSGLSIRTISEETLHAFGEVRPYDLIVLQYGLNVATDYGRDYSRYAEGMSTAISRLKAAFPKASLLLIGVGDRDHRDEEGRVRTMPGIKHLVAWQQRLAADNGIAFWNLFEAMGGEGSMARLAEENPPMANRDYAHINFLGGKHLADLLYEALSHGKEQSDKRRAYELE